MDMQEDISKQKKQPLEAAKNTLQNTAAIKYQTMKEISEELEANRRRLASERYRSDEDYEEACAIYAEQLEHWFHHQTDDLPEPPFSRF